MALRCLGSLGVWHSEVRSGRIVLAEPKDDQIIIIGAALDRSASYHSARVAEETEEVAASVIIAFEKSSWSSFSAWRSSNSCADTQFSYLVIIEPP